MFGPSCGWQAIDLNITLTVKQVAYCLLVAIPTQTFMLQTKLGEAACFLVIRVMVLVSGQLILLAGFVVEQQEQVLWLNKVAFVFGFLLKAK